MKIGVIIYIMQNETQLPRQLVYRKGLAVIMVQKAYSSQQCRAVSRGTNITVI